MPTTYAYKVRDQAGKIVQGTVEADSENAVVGRLRQMGLRVVLIDWDLEAPGLETFFCLPGHESELAALQSHVGLIDMVVAYRDAYPTFSAQRLRRRDWRARAHSVERPAAIPWSR